MAATQKVFNTAELLEHILLHLPLRTLYLAGRVNKTFTSTMLGSSMINKALWLQPSTDCAVVWRPDSQHDGTPKPNNEVGVWSIGAGSAAAATPILNPFLTITRKVAEEGGESNFQYYDDVGLHLAADGTHGLTFTNDGTYQSRLDLTYKYDIDLAEPKSSQGIDNMLIIHLPCVSLRLLHRSADPQEDMKSFWSRHGLRKAEFDVRALTYIKVGTLLEGMMVGAPSIEDQEEYRRSLREKSKVPLSERKIGGGLAGPANAIMNMASMIEGWSKSGALEKLFGDMGLVLNNHTADGENSSQAASQTESIDPAPVAEDTTTSTTGPETHKRPENDAQDFETTAKIEEPESTNEVLKEPIRHPMPNENIEHANDATETQAGEVAKAEEPEDVEAAPPYTAEYALVGGTDWCILQGTVDTITGWEMLDIFDMSQEEISKQDRIQ
ncbi:hypothetical protein LTR56_008813 [Elasticomyces elasticus]|nr:hypothetical protein LTR22_021714 [Elasticomyces elasticus]KAK3645935.1 hypothetical protein LTR56_008813 [Elasticomyces elasticus]KAK4928114.1 hypothetical protein LTR49_005052 [Elasticomyces elasticus]KAK5765867.1 hypothetical protein LTS12_003874 [Elasticomyces elasticus]